MAYAIRWLIESSLLAVRSYRKRKVTVRPFLFGEPSGERTHSERCIHR